MLCVQAEPLRRVLAAKGQVLWSSVLGEKIYWVQGRPSADRTEVFAAAALIPRFEMWGMTVEYRDTEERSRLLIERPLAVARTRT
jgi:hypothetical protein